VPNGPELIRRIAQKYRTVQEAGEIISNPVSSPVLNFRLSGCVFLVAKEDLAAEMNPLSLRESKLLVTRATSTHTPVSEQSFMTIEDQPHNKQRRLSKQDIIIA
jgi:hypothetical protein